jgi:hypothetical protein
MLAQGAVSAIRTGCEMLQQGQAVIDEFKGDAESIVGQINEVKEQALGLWETISGLIEWGQGLWASLTGRQTTAKPEKSLPSATSTETKVEAVSTPKPLAKKTSRKQPQRELTYEEYKAKAIHDVCEQLKVFFEAQRQLKQHCRELEEQSLTTERIADSAIDRIEIETQLVNLSTQIREAMSWTPEDLGLQDMYKRFLKMYDLILEEQEFERQRKLMNARKKRWQQEARHNFRIDLIMWAVAMSVVVSAWWWMMVQVVTLTGFYTE